MNARRTWIDLPHAVVSALEWLPKTETAAPVLLLHGGGADNAELSWVEVGSALAEAETRVIAPDHPGFGRSPRASWSLTQEGLVRHVRRARRRIRSRRLCDRRSLSAAEWHSVIC